MLADGVATGFALRRLGDRARLLNFLVARLKQKVWSPDTQNVQVSGGDARRGLAPQWPWARGLPLCTCPPAVRSCCVVSVRGLRAHGEAW